MVQILIDVHCHINLYLTIDKVIKNARDVGVEKIVAVAMSSISQERVLEITSQYDEIFASLGVHPEEVKMNAKIEHQLDSIIELIKKNKQNICAIGEIGLDHYFIKDKELYPLQKTIFDKMLSLAQDLELPVNLHTKGAEEIVFDILPSYKIPNVNIHWYSGPEEFIKLGIDRGYYFSITPAISYSPVVKKVVLNIDKEHLLLESDGPVKYSGEVGVPAMIKNVLKSISVLKEINLDELEKQIEANTKKIFTKMF
ncbi:MAG: TatD family hydrolase [Candidatus Lokiarchaeota archaeon]|nr:TatD family hydrolase [Candidatus Lokiarchaeota archaeon]